MRLVLPGLAIATGLLASAAAGLSPRDIPPDMPVSALLESAQSHFSRRQTADALVYYDAAISKDPSNYLSLFKRATAYLSLGRFAHATDDLNKVLALQPAFEGAHMQLAKIRAKSADWPAARAAYLAARLDVHAPQLQELDDAQQASILAEASEQASQWEDCVRHASAAIAVASRSPTLRERRARCRFERGELEEGLVDLQHVLQLRPGDTKIFVLLSATAFYGLGDMGSGLTQVRKCLHFDPDSPICKQLNKQEKAIKKTYTRIDGQLNKGQFTTAGRALAGIDGQPGLITDIRNQADELRKAGSLPPRAKIRLYEQAVEMACQAYSESSHKGAAKYCDEAMQLDPDSFWGLIHRGKTLIKEDDLDAAIKTLERAAEVQPERRDKVDPILNEARLALKRSKGKDYYKILGVANDADERQIKSAYRKASKQHHPDKAAKRGIAKEDAEKKMASINEAYEVLSNKELRARFDSGDDPNSQEGGTPFEGNPFGGGHPFMFHQQGGGPQAQFKFHFGGPGGAPFGF